MHAIITRSASFTVDRVVGKPKTRLMRTPFPHADTLQIKRRDGRLVNTIVMFEVRFSTSQTHSPIPFPPRLVTPSCSLTGAPPLLGAGDRRRRALLWPPRSAGFSCAKCRGMMTFPVHTILGPPGVTPASAQVIEPSEIKGFASGAGYQVRAHQQTLSAGARHHDVPRDRSPAQQASRTRRHTDDSDGIPSPIDVLYSKGDPVHAPRGKYRVAGYGLAARRQQEQAAVVRNVALFCRACRGQ